MCVLCVWCGACGVFVVCICVCVCIGCFYFSRCTKKIPEKQLKKGSFWPILQAGHGHHGEEDVAAESGGGWLHCLCSQEVESRQEV